jgi:two-component system, sensor histidine kinase PdtaS
VHEEMHLIRSDQTRLDEVLRRIVQLAASSLTAKDLQVDFTADPVQVQARFGSSLAIIANELITNAIKHSAGSSDTERRLSVELLHVAQEQSICLSIWNSGEPVPEDFDPARQDGLGLQLVRMLVVEQAKGSFAIRPHNSGTLATVTVPVTIMS